MASMTATGVLTNYGIAALSSAPQGGYVPPLYLVIENNGSTLNTAANAGTNSLQIAARVDLTNDTKLVVGVGLTTQEVVTFSGAPSGSSPGPYTYTLSTPLVNAHASGEHVARLPLVSDTMLQVQNEIEYDHANQPGQRLQSVSGYSSGPGQWTMQFFISGIEASSYLTTVGLSESPQIGQGNLHEHSILGINHVYNAQSGGVDIEIDIPITLTVSQ